MSSELKHCKVAILAVDGFEESELTGPLRALTEAASKPIAVICHGGWLPVSAGVVSGRTMTSWPSLQDDIRNAGGTWVDQRVVRDGHFVTSRKPDDLPAFNAELIACLQSSAPLWRSLSGPGRIQKCTFDTGTTRRASTVRIS
ncbi:DJ-1/PfpI family protein [Paraburkholderia sacchari]|uniref:DJ-1/PfpI family protein n=1 Tax=Paraburkholderia sacchari TaxID=159450 RepID=UPI001BCAEAFB|nr:DJ-1/PfpI family protein [Paraburkholderia sacchari]